MESSGQLDGELVSNGERSSAPEDRGLELPQSPASGETPPWATDAEVRRFVAEWFARPPQEVHAGVRLQADLGLTAAPAVRAFVEAFARRFGVDAAGFRPERHFRGREGRVAVLLRTLRLRPPSPPALPPITVGDLTAAAWARRLTP